MDNRKSVPTKPTISLGTMAKFLVMIQSTVIVNMAAVVESIHMKYIYLSYLTKGVLYEETFCLNSAMLDFISSVENFRFQVILYHIVLCSKKH